MLLDITYEGNIMSVSYINKGKVYVEDYKVGERAGQFRVWEVCDEHSALKGWRNWDGAPVKLTYGYKFNMFDRMQFLNQLPKEKYDFMHEYSDVPVLCCDIETEIQDGFPYAVDQFDRNGVRTHKGAATPIVSMSATAGDEDLTTTLLTIDTIDEEICAEVRKIVNEFIAPINGGKGVKLHILAQDNELEMLNNWMDMTREAPILTYWNGDEYDMPYQRNRLKQYGKDMSRASIKNSVNYNKDSTHKFIPDMMDLFKSMATFLIPGCASFRLDYVTKHLLGLGKLPMPPDPNNPKRKMGLKELREYDLARFLAYGAIDTIILQLLHKKINIIAMAFHKASLSFTTLTECQSPVSHSAGIMIKDFLQTEPNTVVAFKDRPEKRKYKGAFVKYPTRHYAKWVVCYDFSALYPSLIIVFNLSPANYIRKFDPTKDNLADIMRNHDYIVTESGSIYKNDKDYFYRTVEQKLYNLRKSYDKTRVTRQIKVVNVLDEIIEAKKKMLAKEIN